MTTDGHLIAGRLRLVSFFVFGIATVGPLANDAMAATLHGGLCQKCQLQEAGHFIDGSEGTVGLGCGRCGKCFDLWGNYCSEKRAPYTRPIGSCGLLCRGCPSCHRLRRSCSSGNCATGIRRRGCGASNCTDAGCSACQSGTVPSASGHVPHASPMIGVPNLGHGAVGNGVVVPVERSSTDIDVVKPEAQYSESIDSTVESQHPADPVPADPAPVIPDTEIEPAGDSDSKPLPNDAPESPSDETPIEDESEQSAVYESDNVFDAEFSNDEELADSIELPENFGSPENDVELPSNFGSTDTLETKTNGANVPRSKGSHAPKVPELPTQDSVDDLLPSNDLPVKSIKSQQGNWNRKRGTKRPRVARRTTTTRLVEQLRSITR